MWFGIRDIGGLAAQGLQALAAVGGAVAALWLLGFRLQVRARHRRRERRIEEELTAYAELDVRLPAEGNYSRTGEASEPIDGAEERLSQGGDACSECGADG